MTDATPPPTNEEIADLAHQYWVDEGCPEGRAEDHWQRAEAELRRRSETTVLPEPTGN